MSKDTSSKRIDTIAEEAAEWYVVLKDADARTKKSFAAWLQTSPEHIHEFLAIASLWDALPELSSQPSVAELVALASAEPNVVAFSSPDSVPSARIETPKVRRRNFAGVAAAAAATATLAAVVIGGALTLMPPADDPNLYSTAIGEQTSLPLADGSIVTLNTQSTLRVAYSEGFRDIYLREGEALFDVAKDAARPFRVITEHAVIQAVGTQFNVHNHNGDVTVTVVEGIVDVNTNVGAVNPSGEIGTVLLAEAPAVIEQAVRLTVGQQARVAAGEVAVIDTTIDRAIAWQQRRLVFESLSLKDVIDEFNRYNDPPLLIDDHVLEALPISGVFRSNDRESFVQFLAQMQLAESHTRSDGTIVLRGMASE